VQELVEEIKADGNFAVAAIADVTDENQLLEVQETLSRDFDKIDVLINAAGGNMPGATVTPDQTLADLSGEDVRKIVDLNYMGTFLPIKSFLPLLIKESKGNIINISSMAASRPMTRVMGYASS